MKATNIVICVICGLQMRISTATNVECVLQKTDERMFIAISVVSVLNLHGDTVMNVKNVH